MGINVALNGALLLKSILGLRIMNNIKHHLPCQSVESQSGWISQSRPQQYGRVESISFCHLEGFSLAVTPVQVLANPVDSESTGDRRPVNHLRKHQSSTVGPFWLVIHMDLSTASPAGNKCFLDEKLRMASVRCSCALYFAVKVQSYKSKSLLFLPTVMVVIEMLKFNSIKESKQKTKRNLC